VYWARQGERAAEGKRELADPRSGAHGTMRYLSTSLTPPLSSLVLLLPAALRGRLLVDHHALRR